MRIRRADLEAAAEEGHLQTDQVPHLWRFLEARRAHEPGFKAAHILYYLGALVAIGAVTLFITLAWDDWSGLPMFLLGVSLAVLGVGLTEWLARRRLWIPVGGVITFAVATVPLIVYSAQQMLGVWPSEDVVTDYHRYASLRWIYMSFATLMASAIAFWRYRQPFVLLLVAVALWYLSMDIVRLFQIEPGQWGDYYHVRRLVTFYLGLLTIGLAVWVDLRSGREPRDYGFWLYLVGVLMFWCGLSFQSSDSELALFGYFLINLALITVGTALRRRVFAVFGALGVTLYLGHLAALFEDSLVFPVLLAAIGLIIVGAGVVWQRYEATIAARLTALLPGALRRRLRDMA